LEDSLKRIKEKKKEGKIKWKWF